MVVPRSTAIPPRPGPSSATTLDAFQLPPEPQPRHPRTGHGGPEPARPLNMLPLVTGVARPALAPTASSRAGGLPPPAHVSVTDTDPTLLGLILAPGGKARRPVNPTPTPAAVLEPPSCQGAAASAQCPTSPRAYRRSPCGASCPAPRVCPPHSNAELRSAFRRWARRPNRRCHLPALSPPVPANRLRPSSRDAPSPTLTAAPRTLPCAGHTADAAKE